MDISILFKIAAVGIIVTVICQILKKSDRDDIATVVSIVGLLLVLGIVVSMVGDLFGQIRDIFGLTWQCPEIAGQAEEFTMEIFRIIGVAFVTAVAAIVLKSSKPELSFAVTVTGVVIILIFVADMLQNTVNIISSIAGMTGIENGLIKILLKIVGIGYLTEFSAGLLNDFGSNAVADKVTLAGKLTILVLSLPVIESVLGLIRGFLELV